MIFFTRELQDGIQEKSGWTRRARREWTRRQDIYRHYTAAIAPILPASVQQLCRKTLHDADVVAIEQRDGIIKFVMDARGALGGFRGQRIQLTFSGVKKPIRTRELKGEGWNCEEAHLSSRARFALHVLFHKTEIEIEADRLSIRKL